MGKSLNAFLAICVHSFLVLYLKEVLWENIMPTAAREKMEPHSQKYGQVQNECDALMLAVLKHRDNTHTHTLDLS